MINISSQGVVTLSNISARSSGGNGILVDNFGSGKPVKITRATVWGASVIGIQLKTSGNVTMTDVSAKSNNGIGALIDYITIPTQR
jgi:hypothetical protein